MTRKDYRAIAEAIRMARENLADTGDLTPEADRAIRLVVSELEIVLKADNVRFDRDRFETAASLSR